METSNNTRSKFAAARLLRADHEYAALIVIAVTRNAHLTKSRVTGVPLSVDYRMEDPAPGREIVGATQEASNSSRASTIEF